MDVRWSVIVAVGVLSNAGSWEGVEQQVDDGVDNLHLQLARLHEASFRWALSCCLGQHSEAEDVLQAAYLKVLEGKARFGGRSSLKTWFFSVIRYTAASRRRRRSLRSMLLRDPKRSEPAPEVLTPEQEAASLERRQKLSAAIAALPTRQREVMELVFGHDLSLSEASEILDLSLGSVRTHYARGKAAMLRVLETRDDY